MTIDETNIATLGLHLSYMDGHLNQPARKNVLREYGHEAKDLVFEAKEPVIDLVGVYSSKMAMATAMMTFTSLIAASLVHSFNMGGHSVTFNGVIADGIKVQTIKTVVKISFKVKIIE